MFTSDDDPGSSPARSRRRTLFLWLSPLLMAAIVAVCAVLVAAALLPVVGAGGAAVKTVDSKFLSQSDLPLELPNLPQRSTIYAADGTPLATLYRGQNREVFPVEDYTTDTRNAVLAIEDHTFYQHGAVDVIGIARAFLSNIRAGRVVAGGSTIAQQLVKNTQTGSQDTIQRKIVEAQDAIRLERTYSKDDILGFYMNTVYLANGVYGIGTAAQYYFNEEPQQLTLQQSALLAGMIQAPEDYNPLRAESWPDAKLRQTETLQQMLAFGWITQAQYQTAVAAPIKFSAKGRTANDYGPQPYWVDFIKHEFLTDPRFGRTLAEREDLLYQGGLQIYTTLNLKIQHAAQASLRTRYNLPTDPQGASVSIASKSGAILAMAGNERYGTRKGQTTFNYGWQAHRHTGSSFKAFTLAAALELGIQPGATYSTTSPLTIPNCGGGETWTINNAEPASAGGFASLTIATADSINVVFAQLINQIGPEAVVTMAHKMGLTSYLPPVCPLTLGTADISPLEMTSAYSTLANDGIRCLPFAISRIVRNGQLIFKQAPRCAQVIPAEVAATETSLLQGVISFGTAARTTRLPDYPARPEAGKTGTDTDFRNAWFVGYVPQITTGVWIGYASSNKPMGLIHGQTAFGANLAGPVWNDVMTVATRGLPIEQFPKPPPQRFGTVPNVVGMQQTAAAAAIAAAHFSPVVQQADSVVPAGTVFSQLPGGGSSAPLGSLVILMVSNGHAPVGIVPNVRGLTQGAAVAAITGAGFRVNVVFQEVGDVKKVGVVLGQSPKGGTTTKQGTTVTITVGQLTSPSPTPTPTPTT